MSQPILLGLSGSLRESSVNRKLLREAARRYQGADFVEASLNLPLYNGDDEDRDGLPAGVLALVDQITSAEAIIISTPEYNSGVSGVLKNALDWVSRAKPQPWTGKPVALLSAAAGRSGGARAHMMLRGMMAPFRPRIALGPEVMLAGAAKEFDENGHLTSVQYDKSLTALMEALRAEVG